MILIWWTSIRLLRNWIRESKDLDYDSEYINEEDFIFICNDISNYINSLWYSAKARFPNYEEEVDDEKPWNNKKILQCTFLISFENANNELDMNISSQINLYIKIDLKDSIWNYHKEKVIPYRSIAWIPVLTARIDSLLSKKIIWFLSRPHEDSVAKDLTDIIFLLQQTKPDYDFLWEYEEIYYESQLLERLIKKYNQITHSYMVKRSNDLANKLFDSNYEHVALDAIPIIKHQLESYKNN